MKKKPGKPFDETSRALLKDPEAAAMYLEDILADGDMDLFKEALKDVAAAQDGGMSALSKKAKLNREQLYKTLSRTGNPRLDTLTKVLHAAGLRLSIMPETRV